MSDRVLPEKKSVKHNFFYLCPNDINGDYACITGKDIHYLRDVMRKNPEEIIQFTDGQGSLYEAEIIGCDRRKIELKILNRRIFQRPKRSVTLAFVPIKGSRNEIIIEKATELGVDEFYMFFSRNSVVNRISTNKLLRFKSIAKQAMLQSQRVFMPPINLFNSIEDIVRQFENFKKIIAMNMGGTNSLTAESGKNLIVVGPEGGFEKQEIEFFRNNGAGIFSLGKHRLRSETAAIAAAVITLQVTET